MDFLDTISMFTGHARDKIGVYVIHLEKAVERIPLMQETFGKLRVNPTNIDGVNGNDIVKNGHPTLSIRGNKHGNGMIGCTCSHVKACRTGLEEGKEIIIIFEDDLVFKKSLEEFSGALLQTKNIFNTYAIKYDMFILGALGYPSFYPNNIGISSIFAFDGSHAILMSRKAAKAYIDSYYNSLSKNNIEAPDGIYTDILRNGMIGFGFTDAKLFFDQKQDGMWSYVGDHLK
jgi:GR25 family glycosyltransferase involved in LPS biosynthesis